MLEKKEESSENVINLFDTIRTLASQSPHFEIITIFGSFLEVETYVCYNRDGKLTFRNNSKFYENEEKFAEKVFPRFGKESTFVLNIRIGDKHEQLKPALVYIFEIKNVKNKIVIKSKPAAGIQKLLNFYMDKKINMELSPTMVAKDLTGGQQEINMDEIYTAKFAGFENENPEHRFDRVYDAVRHIAGESRFCGLTFNDPQYFGKYFVQKDEREDMHFTKGNGETLTFSQKLGANMDKLFAGGSPISCTMVVSTYDYDLYRDLDYYYMFTIETWKGKVKIRILPSENVRDLMKPICEAEPEMHENTVFCDLKGRVYSKKLSDEMIQNKIEEEEAEDDMYDEDGNYIGDVGQLCSVCGIINDILKIGQEAYLNIIPISDEDDDKPEDMLEMIVVKNDEKDLLYKDFEEEETTDQHDALYSFLNNSKCSQFVVTCEIMDYENSVDDELFVDHYAFYIYVDGEYTNVEPISAEENLQFHIDGHEKDPDKIIKQIGNTTFCDTDGIRIEADMFVNHARKLRDGKTVTKDEAFYDVTADTNEFYSILNKMIGKNSEAVLFMQPVNDEYWHGACVHQVKKTENGLVFGDETDEDLLFRGRLVHSAECGASFRVKVMTQQIVDGLKVSEYFKIKTSMTEHKKVIVGVMSADDVQKAEFRPGETNPYENKVFCDLKGGRILQWDLPGYRRENYSKNLRLSLRNKNKKKDD